MKIGYLDCISGISGDMMLGALVDVGVPLEHLNEAVQSLGLPPEVSLSEKIVKRGGFRAVKVDVNAPHEHVHRHLSQILDIVNGSTFLDDRQKETVREIFQLLAEAEAKVHGTTVEEVHFHEVGAVDSIVDIVATVVGLSYLKLEYLAASPVPTGCGTIKIAHGTCSIPTPATAELLTGIPLERCSVPFELTTPTGAAILKHYVHLFGPIPTFTIEKTGYGAGTRDMEERPNVLRLLYGKSINPQRFISRVPSVPTQFLFPDELFTTHAAYEKSEKWEVDTEESEENSGQWTVDSGEQEGSADSKKLPTSHSPLPTPPTDSDQDNDQDVVNALNAIEDAMAIDDRNQYAEIFDSIGLENPGLLGPVSFDDSYDPMKESWDISPAQEEEDSAKHVLLGVIQQETIWVLETNLDDVSGEILGYCFEKLWALDILDAYTNSILMKKGRAGVILTVLCREHVIASVERILFMETTTLGIRKYPIQRSFLDRKPCYVKTPWGEVAGKIATMPDGTQRFSPEYESAKIIAELNFVPLQKVYDLAKKGFEEA